MKRSFRLTRTSDFQRVRRMGKSYAHPLVVLITARNNGNFVRVGVTAGAAVGNAVQRNRAKRRLRAAIQPWLERINPGMDLVLIARKPLCAAEFTRIGEALQLLIEKAKLVVGLDESKNTRIGESSGGAAPAGSSV